MHVCRARVRLATTRSPARLPRYESVSQADGFQLEPDHNYVDERLQVQSCFARRWSGYEMQLLAAKSSAFMSMPRIGSPAVTPIKCS